KLTYPPHPPRSNGLRPVTPTGKPNCNALCTRAQKRAFLIGRAVRGRPAINTADLTTLGAKLLAAPASRFSGLFRGSFATANSLASRLSRSAPAGFPASQYALRCHSRYAPASHVTQNHPPT